MSNTNFTSLTADEHKKLYDAIERLAANNPDVVKQMQCLADLKEKQPQKWAMGLKILGLK